MKRSRIVQSVKSINEPMKKKENTLSATDRQTDSYMATQTPLPSDIRTILLPRFLTVSHIRAKRLILSSFLDVYFMANAMK